MILFKTNFFLSGINVEEKGITKWDILGGTEYIPFDQITTVSRAAFGVQEVIVRMKSGEKVQLLCAFWRTRQLADLIISKINKE